LTAELSGGWDIVCSINTQGVLYALSQITQEFRERTVFNYSMLEGIGLLS
jgi:hypothetical protein